MEDGLIRMMEAAGIKTLDMVSPFLDSFIDTCFGESDRSASIINVLTK